MVDKKGVHARPLFKQFVEANKSLLDCYSALGKETIADMTQSQRDTQCLTEKNEIKRILNSN